MTELRISFFPWAVSLSFGICSCPLLKVIAEYLSQGGFVKSEEKLWAKFHKKVTKNPNLKVLKDRVKLVHVQWGSDWNSWWVKQMSLSLWGDLFWCHLMAYLVCLWALSREWTDTGCVCERESRIQYHFKKPLFHLFTCTYISYHMEAENTNAYIFISGEKKNPDIEKILHEWC